MARKPLRVGLAGLGAVGLDVARRIEAGIPGLVLVAVSVATMVWVPAVSKVASKIPVPLVRVTLLVRKVPRGSVVTKCTVPL